MTDEEPQEPDPSIVPPAPIEVEPSSTGLVADDEAAEVDDEVEP